MKTYSSTKELLEISINGIWKLHPLRKIIEKGKQLPSLRYDLNKQGWAKVIKKKSFANIGLTIRAGKQWMNEPQAKTIHFKSNEDGVCEIPFQTLEDWRQQFSINIENKGNETQDMQIESQNEKLQF